MKALILSRCLVTQEHVTKTIRVISTATTQCYKFEPKLNPYNIRFPLSPLDIEDPKKVPGGNKQLAKLVEETRRMAVQKPGVYDKQGKFHHIREMEPEFIVPDLSKCKLQPYVSYAVKDITQKEMTPDELFEARYAERMRKDFQAGKLTSQTDLFDYMNRLTAEKNIRPR